MFLNDFECERFRYGAEVLLNTVNPYTKKRLADDPLLMSVELYNEMEVGADLVSNFYYWNNVCSPLSRRRLERNGSLS